MRPLIQYGIPAAAGLAVGGGLMSQGEAPGTAALGALAGGLGAYGATQGARLAGKYAPALRGQLASKAIEGLGAIGERVPAGGKRAAAVQGAMGPLADAINAATDPQFASRLTAAAGIPAAAGAAGLGGVALGAIPGAFGVPGFQQGVITDPELAGSSNTPMARASTPTLRYLS